MKTVPIICLLTVICLISTAAATSYYVNDATGNDAWDGLASAWDGVHGPKKTIQAGIDASTDTDTVQVADGTYKGEGNRDLDFGGRAITLKSENGAENTIIDCEDVGRGFYFHSGEGINSILDGFTIRNGFAKGYWPDTRGGGIYCSESSPTISNCTISGNEAKYGGGISCNASDATITNCTITGNSADRDGGGINCRGVDSTLVITKCTITGNAAYNRGGGIHCSDGSGSAITNCIIIGNLGSYGGGIACHGTNPDITNCTIRSNGADFGGGIYCNSAAPIITNCILWNDEPEEIYAESSSFPTLSYCDVQGGWSGDGNIDLDPSLTPDGHLTIASPCIDRCPAGPVEDIDDETRPFPIGEGYDIGADEFVDVDLDGLPDWWETHHFGSATGASAEDDVDLDGLPNLGEYENATDPWTADSDGDGRNDGTELSDDTNPLHPDNAEKTYYVSTSAGDDTYDGLAASWDGVHGPKASIQAGIDATVTAWDYTVLVANGDYRGEGNRDLDFGGRAIALRSQNGAEDTTIDCEGSEADPHRGFYIHLGEGVDTIVDGFTITNGDVSDSGGGILCHASSPTITNCIISNNRANGSRGGGIRCRDSSPTISDCTISDNWAYWGGGGIQFGHSNGPPLTRCVIRNNRSGHQGGGISCEFSNLEIRDCTIAGNTAAKWGGGIYWLNSSPTVTNCTLTGNSAYAGGGLACTQYCAVTVVNCILWGNSAVRGPEIAVYNSYHPSTLTAAYSDIEGGEAEVYVQDDCVLLWGDGNVNTDPILTPDGHIGRGSPCIDWCPNGTAGDQEGEGRPVDIHAIGFDETRIYDIGADEFVDADFDGLPDWWELKYFGSATTADAAGDGDLDSLTNLQEYLNGTDPQKEDTDNDGRSDGIELAEGTNPLHVDNADRTYYVNGATGDDTYDGLAVSWDGVHGPKATIQAGIDATVTAWGYTVLVANGCYTGEGNRDVDFRGKAVTLRSENGPDETIIDCENSGQGLHFRSGEGTNSVVEGFSIRNGSGYSGGIRCYYSSPTITSCIIRDNAGGYGAGIYCYRSDPVVTNCVVAGNSADRSGGGIYCMSSSPTITNCTITGNVASEGGGGILCEWGSRIEIVNSILWGNSAPEGDEISLVFSSDPCTLTVSHCDVQGGEAAVAVEEPCSLIWSFGNIDVEPKFVDAEADDFRLIWESPCIDAGDNNAPALPNVDLDRYERIQLGRTSSTVDMGAYEFGEYFTFSGISRTPEGIELAWLSNGNANVSYTAWYSDGPFSDSMVWSALAATIPTGGSMTTSADPSPPLVGERYYRIQDGSTGLYSRDTVGLMWKTLPVNRTLVSTPFVPFDTSLDAVVGNVLSGSENKYFSDTVESWNPSTEMYDRAYYDPAAGSWKDWQTEGSPVFDFEPDKGYWISILPFNPSAEVCFFGRVSPIGREMDMSQGRSLCGSTYPMQVTLDETGLVSSGFAGDSNPYFSDVIEWWNTTIGDYDRAYYDPTGYGEWKNWDGTPATETLVPCEGFWVNIMEWRPPFTWMYPKPYSQPPNN